MTTTLIIIYIRVIINQFVFTSNYSAVITFEHCSLLIDVYVSLF